jgi:hypothetical protein
MAGTTTETTQDLSALEEGFALLEAVIASVLLLVIVVPVASLVATGASFVGSTQARGQAQALAVQNVQQLVGMTQFSLTFPPVAGLTATSWTPTGTTTVDGRPFSIFEAAGWCVVIPPANQFTSGSFGSGYDTAYFVAVKVQWGPGASSPTPGTTNAVVTDGAVSVPQSSVPLSGTATCPVGLQ